MEEKHSKWKESIPNERKAFRWKEGILMEGDHSTEEVHFMEEEQRVSSGIAAAEYAGCL